MCGIAGIINYNNPEEKKPLLRKMINILNHRGPDSSGFYENGPTGLAHARLSIIDLHTGDQPVYNEDKSACIVFNGEIFNYPELREDLIRKGHRFYTQSDTEVIIHLYEEYDSGLFEKLNGQFAIAIWDEKKQKLLLGRDRTGIRPLFYHLENERLVFASEVKAIFLDNTINREVNPETLSDIFTCWAPLGSATIFKGITQLLPGHFAVYDKMGLRTEQYWQIPFGTFEYSQNSFEELKDEFLELITDSVRIRLRSDVPVGAYLSGGIDSTFTSSLVKKKFNNLLNTFSVGFTDKKFDESSYQNIAVRDLKTDHHDIFCTDADIGADFPSVIWHTETPILRTAPVPLFKLSKLVQDKKFKVVLTGEGADEVFAGYNIFKEDIVRRFWAKRPDSKIRPKLLGKLYPYIFNSKDGSISAFHKKFFSKNLTDINSPVYSHFLRWNNTSQTKQFFSKDYNALTSDLDGVMNKIFNNLPKGFMSRDSLSRAQYLESSIFLSNYLLSSQGDRMAMGNSVEGRYPFLDYRVIEFAAKVPPKFRMNGLTEKYILKEAARGFIPDELIDRPKQPYRAPISSCFFGDKSPEYIKDLLSEDSLNNSGYFDGKKVTKLIAKSTRKNGTLLSERENMALVGIISTQLIDKMFIKNLGM